MKTVKKIVLLIFGALLAVLLLLFGSYFQFEKQYKQLVYPGIYIDGSNLGGLSTLQIESLFIQKNKPLKETSLTLQVDDHIATFSAEDLKLKYDTQLAIKQAYDTGHAKSSLSTQLFKIQSFVSTLPFFVNNEPIVSLHSSLSYDIIPVQEAIDQFSTLEYIAPIEPQFEFDENINRVTVFALGKNGVEINKSKAESLAVNSLLKNLNKHSIVNVTPGITEPKTRMGNTEDLGITELISEGESFYRGSIPGRIHNIALAASRVSGLLVGPGEVISFNETVGDISTTSGYQSAYIIKNGRTILGDGGGVCQVSTTLFRAALNAGLEIVDRTPHSYRVAYYEQGGFKPGLDATVYQPSVDLKFRNTTENYILIEAENDPDNFHLVYKIYGKKDGRNIELSDVRILGLTAAPPPLYQEDPTLSTGQIIQVDWAAGGAKTTFDYKVTKDGQVLGATTFNANFQPWQAVYLYGPGTEVPTH